MCTRYTARTIVFAAAALIADGLWGVQTNTIAITATEIFALHKNHPGRTDPGFDECLEDKYYKTFVNEHNFFIDFLKRNSDFNVDWQNLYADELAWAEEQYCAPDPEDTANVTQPIVVADFGDGGFVGSWNRRCPDYIKDGSAMRRIRYDLRSKRILGYKMLLLKIIIIPFDAHLRQLPNDESRLAEMRHFAERARLWDNQRYFLFGEAAMLIPATDAPPSPPSANAVDARKRALSNTRRIKSLQLGDAVWQ